MKKLTSMLTIMACLSSPLLFAGNVQNEDLDSAYVSGFLAGAKLTDGVIIKRLNSFSKNGDASSFVKRAFATRVGEREKPVPATYYAGYCLPENISEKAAVNAIIKHIESSGDSNNLEKGDVVFLAVKQLYPCK